jgi:hypothetical protein
MHPFVRLSKRDLWARNINIGKKARRVRWIYNQMGGVEKTVDIAGYTFLYEDKTEEEDEYDRSIMCIARSGGICFRIDFSEDIKTIDITTVSYYSTCAQNKALEEGEGTKIMYLAIMKIILTHPNVGKYDKILLTDNSTRLVPTYDGKRKVKVLLMDMYYLCTGCSWYASVCPMFMANREDETLHMEERNNIVGEKPIKYEEFLNRLKYINELAYSELQTIVGYIGINADNNASYVLNEIRKVKVYSEFFNKHNRVLISAMSVTSLNGTKWCIAIEDGKLLAPEHPTCIHESGNQFVRFTKVVSDEDYEHEKIIRQERPEVKSHLPGIFVERASE